MQWIALFRSKQGELLKETFETDSFETAASWVFTRKWYFSDPHAWKCISLQLVEDAEETENG